MTTQTNTDTEKSTEAKPDFLESLGDMLDSPNVLMITLLPLLGKSIAEDKENRRGTTPELYYGLKSKFRRFATDLKKAAQEAEDALAKFH